MPQAVIAGTPTTAVAAAASTNLTLAVPAGAAAGETLVAILTDQSSSATAPFSASGWTRQGPAFVSSSSAHRTLDVLTYSIPVGGTPPSGSVTFTPSSGSNGRKVGMMLRLQNVDLTNPVLAFTGWSAESTSSATLAVTGFTPSASALCMLFFEANFASPNSNAINSVSPGTLGATSASAVTGGPVISPTGGSTSVSRTLLAVWAARTASNIPTQTVTFAAPAANRSAYFIAFKDAADAPVTTPGVSIVTATGATPTAVGAKMSYWDGSAEQPISGYNFALGDTNIAKLIKSRLFKVAHRGGSACWPEMTAKAYARCIIYEMKALEMSVHASSDGVLVLHHDPTTTRATGQNYTIATTPWSTLSGLNVLASKTDNPNQPDEPIARLDAVLPLYASNHVIFIEDKTYSSAVRTQLLNYIQTFSDYQNRFIWKVAGPANSNAANAGASIGLKSWGYFFTGADMSDPNFAVNAARFDYIGVDYNFTSAEWAQAEATGKPMIAHIIATQAQLDTVKQHPIKGVMLAQVRDLSKMV